MDKQTINYYLKILGLVVVAGIAIYLIPGTVNKPASPTQPTGAVKDYASCVAAGYPSTSEFCQGPEQEIYVSDSAVSGDNSQQPQQAEVVIDSPKEGDLVKSPLTITGKAKGNWFFEASMPVTLKDEKGNVLAQTAATAKGSWMTVDYVEFSAQLKFSKPATEFGVIVIEPDNPSGLPNDKSVSIPVRFK